MFWAKSISVAVCVPEESPWWPGMVVEVGEGGCLDGRRHVLAVEATGHGDGLV